MMSYRVLCFLFTLLLILFVPIKTIQAQQVGPAIIEKDKGWFTLGLSKDTPLDIGIGFTANFGRKHIWQAGLQSSSEFTLSGSDINVNAVNIGRGYSLVNRVGRIAIAAGPAFVWGDNRVDRKLDDFRSVGLVLNGQAILTPVKEIGIGIELFSNLNPELSVAGFRVILAIEGNK